MASKIKFKAPALHIPPQQYNQSLFQRTFSVLRLYFNQIDNQFRENLNNPTIDGDLTVSGTVTAPTFVGALTGNATTATLASTATVTDSTANTDFPVAFHNESNALLDDTGVFEYNPSTGTLNTTNVTATGTISVFNNTSEAALLKVGRDDNQDITMFGDDNTLTIKAAQDSDSNGNHSLILDRVFGGTGLSDFRVRHDGSDEFVISDNGGTVTATFNSSVVINDDLLKVISTDAGAVEKPILALYRNSASVAVSDEIGAIEFRGNDASGAEMLYANIYSEISVFGSGSEQAHLNFGVRKANGFEDPVMRIRQYAVEILDRNTLDFARNSFIKFEGSNQNSHETSFNVVDPTQDNTILLPNNSGVLELGALGSGAVVTGTSIAHAVFTDYRGQKVVFTGSSNCTIQLPDVAAGDVGATWTVCNAGSANVIFDLNGSGSAQTLKILTGAAVTTVGTDDPHIIPGGVASLVCTAADNYILFGSGVVDN